MMISARKIQNGRVKGGVSVLNVVIREGLTERVIFEQRCEGGEGTVPRSSLGKRASGGNNQPTGP